MVTIIIVVALIPAVDKAVVVLMKHFNGWISLARDHFAGEEL